MLVISVGWRIVIADSYSVGYKREKNTIRSVFRCSFKKLQGASCKLRNKIQIFIDSRLFFGGWSGPGLGWIGGR